MIKLKNKLNFICKYILFPFPKIIHLIFSGIFVEKISIEESSIYINKNTLWEQSFLNENIMMITYTIQQNFCYLYIIQNDEEVCNKYKNIVKYGIQYKLTDSKLNQLVTQMIKYNILLFPSIKYCNIFLIGGGNTDYSISQYAFVCKKYLLTVQGATNNRLYVSEFFSNEYKEVSYKNLFLLLESFKDFFKEKTIENKEERNFNIHILDKNYTLNRGYGLYPFLKDKILEDKIFYSFKEEEIKNKIIELFAGSHGLRP